MRYLCTALILPALLSIGCRGSQPTSVPVSVAPADAPRADSEGSEPPYVLLEREGETTRPIPDEDPRTATVAEVFDRPVGAWMLELAARSRAMAVERCGDDEACLAAVDHPPMFVAVPGGNRPKHGLSIASGPYAGGHPDTWYLELDAEAPDIALHELGHVLMFTHLPGDVPPHPPVLPHTTSAITNDVTAFSEGFGIHFETIAAAHPEEPSYLGRADVQPSSIGTGPSFVHVRDPLNYAQTHARRDCVPRNCFAYLPRPHAPTGPTTAADVWRRWTDSTIDPTRVRSLPQMVASEGLIATLFYRLGAAAPDALPDPDRYAELFAAFGELTEARMQDRPAVLVFVERLMLRADPEERRRIATILLETMHYTPVDPEAPAIYAALHEAAVALDKDAYQEQLEQAARRWQAALDGIVADPTRLTAAPVPEVWIVHPTVSIDAPRLGLNGRPLVLDLNTAPLELLTTLPSVDLERASAIDRARRRSPLSSPAELANVEELSPETVKTVAGWQWSPRLAGTM